MVPRNNLIVIRLAIRHIIHVPFRLDSNIFYYYCCSTAVTEPLFLSLVLQQCTAISRVKEKKSDLLVRLHYKRWCQSHLGSHEDGFVGVLETQVGGFRILWAPEGGGRTHSCIVLVTSPLTTNLLRDGAPFVPTPLIETSPTVSWAPNTLFPYIT